MPGWDVPMATPVAEPVEGDVPMALPVGPSRARRGRAGAGRDAAARPTDPDRRPRAAAGADADRDRLPGVYRVEPRSGSRTAPTAATTSPRPTSPPRRAAGGRRRPRPAAADAAAGPLRAGRAAQRPPRRPALPRPSTAATTPARRSRSSSSGRSSRAAGRPPCRSPARRTSDDGDDILPSFDDPGPHELPRRPRSSPASPCGRASPGSGSCCRTLEHPGLPAESSTTSPTTSYEYLVEERPDGPSALGRLGRPRRRRERALRLPVRAGRAAAPPAPVQRACSRACGPTDRGHRRRRPRPPHRPDRPAADAAAARRPDPRRRSTPPRNCCRPGNADARADLYSFGAMLYSLHVGRELNETTDFDRPGQPQAVHPALPRHPPGVRPAHDEDLPQGGRRPLPQRRGVARGRDRLHRTDPHARGAAPHLRQRPPGDRQLDVDRHRPHRQRGRLRRAARLRVAPGRPRRGRPGHAVRRHGRLRGRRGRRRPDDPVAAASNCRSSRRSTSPPARRRSRPTR